MEETDPLYLKHLDYMNRKSGVHMHLEEIKVASFYCTELGGELIYGMSKG